MKLHILGIAGTFMGGVAALARELGHTVAGSDANIYPPMSTQLEQLGIVLKPGYAPDQIAADTDVVVIGNALSRGNPAVEHVLDTGMNYTSGAEWLREQVLPGRTTLAVAGTHGKTTTTSILAFVLDQAGCDPGFLIGGVAEDFGVSARLGSGTTFVVEADEYDTAFFDKRSKFVHYRPRVAILNNLEYDHADIFPDIAAIQRQFHHLVRTVPGNGRLIVNGNDARLDEVLAMGCWTPVERFGIHDENKPTAFHWSVRALRDDASEFEVLRAGQPLGIVRWNLLGYHNALNALAALAAAHVVGVDIVAMLLKLGAFQGVKRRLESIGTARGVAIIDDFAHHPTAIEHTLAGLRARVWVRVDWWSRWSLAAIRCDWARMRRNWRHRWPPPMSSCSCNGPICHGTRNRYWLRCAGKGHIAADVDQLLATLSNLVRDGDTVVFMSNGGFDGAPRRLLAALQA